MGHNWFRFDPQDIYVSRGIWTGGPAPALASPAGAGSWGWLLYEDRELRTGLGWGSDGTWVPTGALVAQVWREGADVGHVEGPWDTPGALFSFRSSAPLTEEQP